VRRVGFSKKEIDLGPAQGRAVVAVASTAEHGTGRRRVNKRNKSRSGCARGPGAEVLIVGVEGEKTVFAVRWVRGLRRG
jgi:hypothetical protein